MNKRLLVFGGKLDDKHYLAKIKALGLEIFAVQKKELSDTAFLASADELLVCDYPRSDVCFPMIAAAHRASPFTAVMSLTEDGLIPAAQASEMLGLRATSVHTARLLKDKWAMRQHLNALGISPVRSAIGRDRADLRKFARSCGGPCIAKPVDGSGSSCICLVKDEGDVEATADELHKAGLATFLMEEFLDGRELSVETFSFNKTHVIIAMTDKWTLPNFVEVGHAVPALVDDVEFQALERCVKSFLVAVGLTDGPAHTEVKMTSNGPRIIESHNRIGGDKIDELVRIAYGVDMVTMTYAWAFGMCEPLLTSPVARAAAAIRFFVPYHGTISSISGVEEVRKNAAVVELEIEKAIGDKVHRIAHSDDRCGHLIVKAQSRHGAVDLCESLSKEIAIATSLD